MNKRWFASATTVLALVAAGCGADSSSTDAVADKINPALAGEDLVICSGWALPLRALESLEPLDSRPEVADALSPFLDSEEGQYWVQEGWQVITVSDTNVLVVVLQTEAQIREDLEERDLGGVSIDAGFGDGLDDKIQMSLQAAELADDEWKWEGASSGEDCELETPVPGETGDSSVIAGRLSDYIGDVFGIPTGGQ